jgi:GAF domain-containing protein
MAQTKKPVQIEDWLTEQENLKVPPGYSKPQISRLAGARTVVSVPMLKDTELIGAFVIYRPEVRPFSDKQIELLKNFAAQAVIAIENTRLLNELRQRTEDLTESLEQQTATSDVLKVISSAQGELQPVFDAILENATRICEAKFGNLVLYDGEIFRRVALYNAPPAWAADQQREPKRTREQAPVLYRLADTKAVVHVADVTADASGDTIHRFTGARSLLIVPMLKGDELIGGVGVYRQEVRPFTDKQIELVQNFASQAVIAIENARLLNELRESLQQQTATADVLKVISSSPGDLQPVFDAMLESATRICGAGFGNLLLYEGGDAFRHVAVHGAPPEYEERRRREPVISLGPATPAGRSVRTKSAVHVADLTKEQVYKDGDASVRFITERAGARTVLSVPMIKDDRPIGTILIYRREVRLFTDKQIELVQNFAAQAVIAIENTRLLNELRQRTDDLSEALEQQTATSEVLKIISSSAGQLEPVFSTMLANATRICEAAFGSLLLHESGRFRRVAIHNAPPAYTEHAAREPFVPQNEKTLGILQKTMQAVHVVDMAAESPESPIAKFGGARSFVTVPMNKDGELIGVIGIYRHEVRPFSEKQIELLTNFAAQAVIAIENTRLLSELRESLQQQTATADVLKVISRSAFDLQVVLETLLRTAGRLCDADMGAIAQRKGDQFFRAVSFGIPHQFIDLVKDEAVEISRRSGTGRVLLEGKVIHIEDVEADPDYDWAPARVIGGFRTLLGVPMLRDGVPTGVLTLMRRKPEPFSKKQIELVATFADQAAIAIENVRLFENLQTRTRELAQSLEDLQTAQDRLVQTQKLASLGQLTAGIAHEIKNPLNFVNNFSSLSTELLDELQDSLKRGQFDAKTRTEIDELTETLRANLDKIEQHGKRADSIVKNMLLHSREGSGEHRPVDINALVEESLNLAYHGARAEKQGFNITLERSFDPAAGEVDVFPQDITRVLLNLIANGFYAATKRKGEAEDGYEPTVSAATKNLGDRVEITIRDNGTGIPPEVKDKMFNPFFTTKPPGEGTGLGLSLSHDIIVKQHAGSIEMDTEPGQFTEFKIILPRAAATIAKTGGRT